MAFSEVLIQFFSLAFDLEARIAGPVIGSAYPFRQGIKPSPQRHNNVSRGGVNEVSDERWMSAEDIGKTGD
jgi:hypothetical protein